MNKTNTLNAIEMKLRNRAKVLNLIRLKNFSRSEIAGKTGLTRASITKITEECIQAGILEEGTKKESSGAGRKSVSLSLKADYGYCIGINISRQGYKVGITDFCINVIREYGGALTPDDNPEAVLDKIRRKIDSMTEYTEGKLLGIGITTPGPLDRQNGVLLNIANFEKWHGFKLKEYFSKIYNCDVYIENNSSAAALAENIVNPGLYGLNFLLLIVDSGLGSGLVITDEEKTTVNDCELGHCTIDIGGAACNCGNIGCGELYASMPSIIKYAQTINPRLTNWKTIADKAMQGDRQCRDIVMRESFYLATIIVNFVNCYNINNIVLAGDIIYNFGYIKNLLLENIGGRMLKTDSVNIYKSCINDPVKTAANAVLHYLIANNSL
jgi:predicted NBD/HSP70 family sugar kinase